LASFELSKLRRPALSEEPAVFVWKGRLRPPLADGSAYQEYVVTEKGRGLYVVLVALRQWGESCLFEPGELDLMLVDRKSGQPVKPLELRSQDGRLLGSADLRTISTSDC
jgi:hypothetical protein